MARPKKKESDKRVKGGYSISPATNDTLEAYVEKNMVIKSRVIERAINEFLERENAKT